jgi:hypothetical protein
MIVEAEKKQWMLNANDRCDHGCNAQAYVYVKGLDGDLLFCAHHYEKIMSSPSGYQKMIAFAIEIVDEREKLVENRLKEDKNV